MYCISFWILKYMFYQKKIFIYLYINIFNLKIFLMNYIGCLKNLIFIFYYVEYIIFKLIIYLKFIINEQFKYMYMQGFDE